MAQQHLRRYEFYVGFFLVHGEYDKFIATHSEVTGWARSYVPWTIRLRPMQTKFGVARIVVHVKPDAHLHNSLPRIVSASSHMYNVSSTSGRQPDPIQ